MAVVSHDSGQGLLLPHCNKPVLLPVGWVVHSSSPLILTGPEGDLQLALFAAPEGAGMEELARNAWMQIDSTFNYPIAQRADVPSTKGWDKACQIVYNIPLAHGKSAVATLRMLDGLAYVGLIYGSRAALSRRMAQVTEILEAWKPSGLKSTSLAEREPTALGEEQIAHLKQFIAEAMQALQVPGASICIVQRGRVAFAEGFGVRKAGISEAVTPSTRFMIGSSTKPLTTLMMARLVDQGAFAWTTPVTALLPDFELGDAETTRRLEVRHTVGACTGMPRRDADFVFRFENISPEERLAQMKTMRPTTGFGETFQYSNLLVAVGGYAAGRCYQPGSSLTSGYESAMQDLIFKPLRMARTCLRQSEAFKDNFAFPHAIDIEGRFAAIDPAMELSVESVVPPEEHGLLRRTWPSISCWNFVMAKRKRVCLYFQRKHSRAVGVAASKSPIK